VQRTPSEPELRLRMDHLTVGEFWNGNAEAWTKLARAGYDVGEERPLYTAGTTAARVDRILRTSDLMAELAGSPALLPLVA
jgi:hypothetical protein